MAVDAGRHTAAFRALLPMPLLTELAATKDALDYTVGAPNGAVSRPALLIQSGSLKTEPLGRLFLQSYTSPPGGVPLGLAGRSGAG
jgi:hypothetical protein